MKLIFTVALASLVLYIPGPVMAQDKENLARTTVCENLARSGQLDAALNCFMQVLESGPDDRLLNLRVAQLLEATGQVDLIGPYLAKVDSSATEVRGFLEMLSNNYGTLKIFCEGSTSCPRYYKAGVKIRFSPPEELEQAKATRLAAINNMLRSGGQLWFFQENDKKASAAIEYFPVVVGVPMPYSAETGAGTVDFNFHFVQRSELTIKSGDLDSIQCAVPDTLVELQVEIDDPEYDALIRSDRGESELLLEKGRYYLSRGDLSSLHFHRKGRPTISRKYLLITSLVLTSAVILMQR
jgi:hypothetical protein